MAVDTASRFGQVLGEAAQGGRPSHDELAAVTPPPGRDASEFRGETKRFVDLIEQAHAAGDLQHAHRLASSATRRYRQRFTEARRDFPEVDAGDPADLSRSIVDGQDIQLD